MNILLVATGSVASITAWRLGNKLAELGEVRMYCTPAAAHFLEMDRSLHLPENEAEAAELLPPKFNFEGVGSQKGYTLPYKKGDIIEHIELRKWASCLVVAPLSANTMAKMVAGICDNLVTDTFRAWDWNRPVILCPAMNTLMWKNPPTAEHIQILRNRGAIIVDPISKKLACGDEGMGALADHETIFYEVRKSLIWKMPVACNGIPINHHPGAFGFHRRKNHHTGVDLYTRDGAGVTAVESGTVVNIEQFTGPELGHDWWEKTWCVMVEGASGVVNYGEISPRAGLRVGDTIGRGHHVGNVKRVLFEDKRRPDIPGHSTSMLHLELYKHGTRECADWHDPAKNPLLLDPTPHLMSAVGAPMTLTWENSDSKTVG